MRKFTKGLSSRLAAHLTKVGVHMLFNDLFLHQVCPRNAYLAVAHQPRSGTDRGMHCHHRGSGTGGFSTRSSLTWPAAT
jgi:hypothetical protein